MGFQQSARIDGQRRATLTQIPAGRYRVHGNGSTTLDIDVPGGPYALEAPRIDCLRVAISDQDGVLHRAGLRPGDLVTSIDGVPFTASTWWQVLSEQGGKQRVPLTLVRGGRTMTLQGGDHPWNGPEVGGSYAPDRLEGR
jgi:S1-C subfamily serine protease